MLFSDATEQTAKLPARMATTWGLAFLAAGILYAVTMAPGLLWGDSGHAQLHTALDGWLVEGQIARSHVLYYWICRMLTRVSEISPARAATVVSLIGGAVTVANVAVLCSATTQVRLAVFCATALLALAHTFWRLSVAAEVVTLSTALISAELLCVAQLLRTRDPRWAYAAGLANGLGVSNHNFALLMWPVYGAILLRERTNLRPMPCGTALKTVAALLLGLTPVLALCIADLRAFGSLSHTLASFLFGDFGRQVFNIADSPRLMVRGAASVVLNFPTPLVLLAVPGAYALVRRGPRPLTWLLLGGLAMFGLFGMRYDVPDQFTFMVPAFIFIPVLVCLGIDHLIQNPGRPGRAPRALLIVVAVMSPAVYAAAPKLLQQFPATARFLPDKHERYRDRFTWFIQPWLTGYDGAERFARDVFDALPPDALLVVDSTLLPPLNYLQAVDNLRRDVRLDCWAARQPWFAPTDRDDVRRDRLARGLVFTTTQDLGYFSEWLPENDYELRPHGIIYEVRARDHGP